MFRDAASKSLSAPLPCTNRTDPKITGIAIRGSQGGGPRPPIPGAKFCR